MRTILAVFAIILGLTGFTSTVSAATFLFMDSEPGDFIGQGQIRDFTTEDGNFSAFVNFDNGVSLDFDGTEFWFLDFAAPGAVPLVPGVYEGATRYPFQSPTEPGLSVSGDGRGCNTLTGRFIVLEAVYVGTTVDAFAADFEQHCEGAEPALFGSIRYNSSIGFLPQTSITANGSFLPIEVSAGSIVEVEIRIEAGDLQGEPSEVWVGQMGPYSDFWLQGMDWIRGNLAPVVWTQTPLVDITTTVFNGRMFLPGVYTFMIAVDPNQDGVLQGEFTDHVVVTVK